MASEQDALAVVDRVRQAHPSASHVVFAWRLDPDRTRCSDDGEPSGTAGRPLLDRLVGQDLEGVVLVVARWFGGTKLGTGGLIRAYGACASAVLEVVEIVDVPRRTRVVVEVPLKLEGPVRGVALQHPAELLDVGWGVDARLTFAVDTDAVEGFEQAVRERTAGAARLTRPD